MKEAKRRVNMMLSGEIINTLDKILEETGMGITTIFVEALLLKDRLRERRKEGWHVVLQKGDETREVDFR